MLRQGMHRAEHSSSDTHKEGVGCKTPKYFLSWCKTVLCLKKLICKPT